MRSAAYLSVPAALERYERMVATTVRAGLLPARAWLAIARRLERVSDLALGERRRKVADRAEDARARARRVVR